MEIHTCYGPITCSFPVMPLTMSSTTARATELGCLLHKSPLKSRSFELAFGKITLLSEGFPCVLHATLLIDINPVRLVHNRRGTGDEGSTLDQYVKDRPCAASSFSSVAIARVFGTAISGLASTGPI